MAIENKKYSSKLRIKIFTKHFSTLSYFQAVISTEFVQQQRKFLNSIVVLFLITTMFSITANTSPLLLKVVVGSTKYVIALCKPHLPYYHHTMCLPSTNKPELDTYPRRANQRFRCRSCPVRHSHWSWSLSWTGRVDSRGCYQRQRSEGQNDWA